MLIYIGTPLMAVGLWKRDDVDRVEASLYRKIMRIGNNISNRAILNTMTSIRLAGEVIYYLSREAQSEYRRQHRVTQYFEQIGGNQYVVNTNNTNNDTNMVGLRENSHSITTNPPNISNGRERKGDDTRASKKKKQQKNGEQ